MTPFEFGNHTDTGRSRPVNEDYLGYFETLNGHLFAVCDGMGGHKGGAMASRIAVDSLRTFFNHQVYPHPAEALRQALRFANQQILTQARQNPDLQGMGTTAVAVLVQPDEVWYAHVGDSRLYHYSTHAGLRRLTKDHSFVQTLVDQGVIRDEEAESHPRRNELTRALGVADEVEIEVAPEPLQPAAGEVLLLASDGLHGMILDPVIRATLDENLSVQHQALKLVQQANDAGGSDNITVQLVRFTDPTPASVISPVPSLPAADSAMPPRSSNLLAATRSDAAPIVLAILALVVLILFFVGYDYMSTDPGSSQLLAVGADSTTAASLPTEDEVEPNGDEVPPTDPQPTPTPETPKPVAGKKDTVINYTVAAGENLSRLSAKFNLKKATIQKLNGMTDENLRAGQTLKIRVRAVHQVGKGDILSVIEKRYGVKKASIMLANNKAADRTERGEKLIIPLATAQ